MARHDGGLAKRQRLEDLSVGVFPYVSLPREAASQEGLENLPSGCFGVSRPSSNSSSISRGANSSRGGNAEMAVAWLRRENHLYLWRITKDRRHQNCVRLSIPVQVLQSSSTFVSSTSSSSGSANFGATYVSVFKREDIEGGIGVFMVSAAGYVCCWPTIDVRAVPVVEALPMAAGTVVTSVHGDGMYLAAGTSRGNVFVAWLSPEDLCLHVKNCAESLPEPSSTEQTGVVAGLMNRFFGFGGGASSTTAASNSPSSTSIARSSSSPGQNRDGSRHSNASDGGSDSEVTDLLIRVDGDSNEPQISVFALYAGREAISRWNLDPQSMETSCAWTVRSLSSKLADSIKAPADAIRLHRLALSEDWLVLMVSSPRGITLHEFRNARVDPSLGISSCMLALPENINVDDIQFSHGIAGTGSQAKSVALVAHEVYDDSTPTLRVHALEFPVRRGTKGSDVWATDEIHDVTTGWFALSSGADRVDGFLLTATCVLGIRLDEAVVAATPKSAEVDTTSRFASSGSGTTALAQQARAGLYAAQPNLANVRRTGPRTVKSKGQGFNDAQSTFTVLKRTFNAFEQESALGRDGMAVAREDNQYTKLNATVGPAFDDAVCDLARSILNGNLAHRWADRHDLSDGNYGSSEDESIQFSYRLISRHLIKKQGRFGENGLIGFLSRARLLENLSPEAVSRLANLNRKLTASISLCNQQKEFSRLHRAETKILQTCQEDIVLVRRKIRPDALKSQLEASGLTVADLFYAQVTEIDVLVRFIVNYVAGKHGDKKHSLTDVIAANNIILTVLTQAHVENQVLAQLAPPEHAAQLWEAPYEIMTHLRNLIRIVMDFAQGAPEHDELWDQLQKLVYIYLAGQRRGEEDDEDDRPDEARAAMESGAGRPINQDEAARLIRAFHKQTPSPALAHHGKGGVWAAYELADAFACHQELHRACLELDFQPLQCLRYEEEKQPFPTYLKKALMESVCTNLFLQVSDNLVDLRGIKGQEFRGVPSSFAPLDQIPPSWRIEQYNIDHETVRFVFQVAAPEDGRYLSYNGSEFVLVSSDGPGEQELFQICSSSANSAYSSSTGSSSMSSSWLQNQRAGEGARREYNYILSWDNVTYLGIGENGVAQPIKYAPHREPFAGKVMELLFEPSREHPSLILDVVEDGVLDKPMLDFLQRQEGMNRTQEEILHKLGWLNSLRMEDYESAVSHLDAHRSSVLRHENRRNNSALDDEKLLKNLGKLCRLAN